MTPQEFKAWFEGFTEAIDGAPDDKQWQRIQEQVKKLDGHAAPVPLPHYPSQPVKTTPFRTLPPWLDKVWCSAPSGYKLTSSGAIDVDTVSKITQ